MSTLYKKIYDPFYDRLEKDETFIDYINLTEQECIDLAKERSHSYLTEAISELTSNCTPDINFEDYDDDLEVISEDLTKKEIKLLVDIMFKIYMERDVPKLHVFALYLTPNELNTFSPANERKSYLDLIKGLQDGIDKSIDNYSSTDRLTGKRKIINYDNYSDY